MSSMVRKIALIATLAIGTGSAYADPFSFTFSDDLFGQLGGAGGTVVAPPTPPQNAYFSPTFGWSSGSLNFSSGLLTLLGGGDSSFISPPPSVPPSFTAGNIFTGSDFTHLTLTTSTFSTLTGTLSSSAITAVPEPTGLALLAAGLAAVGVAARRRTSRPG